MKTEKEKSNAKNLDEGKQSTKGQKEGRQQSKRRASTAASTASKRSRDSKSEGLPEQSSSAPGLHEGATSKTKPEEPSPPKRKAKSADPTASRPKRFHSKQDEGGSPRQKSLADEITRMTIDYERVQAAHEAAESSRLAELPVELEGEEKRAEQLAKALKRANSQQWAAGNRATRGGTTKSAKANQPRGWAFVAKVLCWLSFFLLCICGAVFAFIALYNHFFAERVLIECSTSECKQIQRDMEAFVDTTVNPCDDFYGIFAAFNKVIAEALTSKTSKTPDKYGMHVLARVYEACRDYMTTDKRDFRDTFREVTDLYEVTSILKVQDRPSMFDLLLKIALETGIQSVFTVGFYHVGSRRVFGVSPGKSIQGKIYSDIADRAEASLSKNLIEMVLDEIPNANRSLVDVVLDIDQVIFLLMLAPRTVRELAFSNINELLEVASPEVILHLLNHNLPETLRVQITENIRVIGYSTIEEIGNAMKNITFLAQKYYYVVNLAADLLRYHMFKEIAKEAPDKLTLLCLRTTRVALRNTWPYLIAKLAAHRGSSTVALSTAQDIRENIINRNVLEIFDSYTVTEIKRVIKETDIVTYDEEALTKLPTDLDYSSWTLGGSFFKVYVHASARETSILLQALHAPNIVTLGTDQEANDLSFHVDLKLLTIPTSYQAPPLLYKELKQVPFYINYAGIGSLLVKELVKALKTASETSKKSQQVALSCLKMFAEMRNISGSESIVSDPWHSDAVLWTYGSRIIYGIMKRIVKAEGNKVFKVNWDSVQHYFFVRFCTLSCTAVHNEEFVERCLIPVISNKDFTDHFNCKDRPGYFQSDTCAWSSE
ncbi:uncharacterized protein LOC135389999 isoform X2 [Ornithodoros turicata]|uniref:uncharacterized protein LOC135389999 isoform X2 n=1 Tax=Ornithodoros turicata TaxID=34597 RepID=UPI0031399A10